MGEGRCGGATLDQERQRHIGAAAVCMLSYIAISAVRRQLS